MLSMDWSSKFSLFFSSIFFLFFFSLGLQGCVQAGPSWFLSPFGVPGASTTYPAGFMMTSSNGNIFRVTDHLCGEFTGPRWIPRTMASDAVVVTRSFDVFFDLRLNKRLSKQSWGWWFETLSCPLWRHCNILNQILVWDPSLNLSESKVKTALLSCHQRPLNNQFFWHHPNGDAL